MENRTDMTHLLNSQIDTIRQAQRSKKIAECQDWEINKALSLVYYMVGLRKQNFPTKEEDVFLFGYLKKNYGHRCIDELSVAFDLAIKGFYDLDAKVYDQFTIAYLVSIMEGYRRHVNEIFKSVKPKDENLLTVPELTDEERKEEIEYWRTAKSKIYPLYLFDYLLKFKLIEWDTEKKNYFLNKAIEIRKDELKSKEDGIYDLRDLNKMLSEGFLAGTEKNIVIAIAKRLVINIYYNKK